MPQPEIGKRDGTVSVGHETVPQQLVAKNINSRTITAFDASPTSGFQAFVMASVGGVPLKCLVDTGAALSLLPVGCFIGPLQPLPGASTLLTVSGSQFGDSRFD